MDPRFGLKDFLLLVLLLAILTSQWLAMKQTDRYHEQLVALNRQTDQLVQEQARMRTQLRDALASGLRGGPETVQRAGDGENDPHDRLRAARALPGFVEGDWCIDAFGTKVARITPLVTTDAYGRAIQNFVLEGLTTVDPQTLRTVPHIAQSWTIEDNTPAWRAYVDEQTAAGRSYEEAIADAQAPPALRVRFTLRRDVVFSDGHPLTAHDVVFSWQLMNNPALNAPSIRQFYDDLRGCVAPSDFEVVFELRQPNFLVPGLCNMSGILPRHFFEAFTVEQINASPGLLMGSGPYRMEDPQGWKPGDPLQVVRNERYWGPLPALQRLVWREVENDVARLTAYRNGEIDLFAAQPEQYEELLKQPEVMARSKPFAYDTVPSGYSYIAWNQSRTGTPTPFADVRVRQAMTHLTPRQAMCDELFLGYASPANGPFAPGSPQRDDTLPTRGHDPERARHLLKEAGFEDRNGDGVLEDAAGRALKFKLTYPSGSALYERIVLYLKDAYARAGVVMEPDPLEFSVMLERLDNQDFDAVTLAWGGGAVEGDIRQMFHSSQANKGGDNFMSYVNPRLDALIDQARTTLDEASRLALWRQCHAILWEDQPYTFMFNRQALRFIDARFENIQRVTAGLNDRDEWFVPRTKQRY